MLILSVCFATYPIWPFSIKKDIVTQAAWNFSILYILVFCSSFFLMLSNFNHLQLVVFIINIIVAAILTRWKLMVVMVTVGIYSSIKTYKYYASIDNLDVNMTPTSLIIYTFLLIGAATVIFLKPRQEQQELTEEKNEHLSERITSQEKQLQEAQNLRAEFIRNVNHEYHAPMTGITILTETLVEHYDKISDEQCRNALEAILQSSRRLDAFDSNLSSLSRLSKQGYELNKIQIDLSELVCDRTEVCRRLYGGNNYEREFILNIQDGVTITGDKYYLTQALDNLIINAINYCKEGKITIKLEQFKNYIALIISDEGIGIPPDELIGVFDEFVVSSKTRSQSGGRGVGLALCKRVIEVHDGEISAESDGRFGTTFKINFKQN
jgi:signal transduction histidine kinase